MAKVKIQGHASGTGVLTVTAPNTSTDRTITLPDATGTLLNSDGDGSNLTGVGVDGISSSADATAITIDSAENVGIGIAPAAINKFQVKQATDINLGVRGAVDTTGSIVIQAVDDAVNNNIPLELRATAVTMPLQPAFRVTKTSDQSLVVNSEIVVAWGSESFDVGSNFSSNVFTAPVSGMYFFEGRVRIDNMDTAAIYYRVGIETSNANSHQIFVPKFTADVDYMNMSLSGVFQLDVGDTADFRARQVSGTASHLDDSVSYTNFCGYLLG